LKTAQNFQPDFNRACTLIGADWMAAEKLAFISVD
jgi:hypothetical protein